MRFIGLMNSYLDSGEGGVSGGDIAFVEIVKRFRMQDKIIITPKSGEKICRSNNMEAEFKNTSFEMRHGNIPLIWFRRLFKTLLIMPKPQDGDILYAGSDFLVDVIPAFLNKIKKPSNLWVQCIFHLISKPSGREGSYVTNLFSHLSQRFSFFLIRNNANLVIVDSPFVKEQLIINGFEAKKIHIGYVGTDINYIKNVKPDTTSDFDAYFMGRFHKSKGIYDLIKIWKLVVKDNPSRKLGLIGAALPERKNELQKIIKENHLEKNIYIFGFLPKEETISRIKNGKLFLFPSHEEGFGIVILEA